MNIKVIPEPLLQFCKGKSVCPRQGITEHFVYGADKEGRRKEILIGAIGTGENLAQLGDWLERGTQPISGKSGTPLNRLFTPFCGFNQSVGFKTNLKLAQENNRQISNYELNSLLKIEKVDQLISEAVQLYARQVHQLSNYHTTDVIICVIPQKLFKKLTTFSNETLRISQEDNFRRALKAKCMIEGGKPLQLIIESTFKSNNPRSQDDATKAWNFFTALYYKANQIGPWRLSTDDNPMYKTCYVGISFYKSRDGNSIHTSLAQVFDDMGRNVILRGTPVTLTKDDRIPHLSSEQSKTLLETAISEFKTAMEFNPGRVVIHKSSNYTPEEVEGFSNATHSLGAHKIDFVTIYPYSKTRIFRMGNYPPLRGTHLAITNEQHILYTRGSVEHYQTYPGNYIPDPLDIRIVQSDTSPSDVCSEILSLTKMNWNNTQFDRKLPITLVCSKAVGDVMKYIPEEIRPQGNYSFYM